jgi:hypothetical protein
MNDPNASMRSWEPAQSNHPPDPSRPNGLEWIQDDLKDHENGSKKILEAFERDQVGMEVTTEKRRRSVSTDSVLSRKQSRGVLDKEGSPLEAYYVASNGCLEDVSNPTTSSGSATATSRSGAESADQRNTRTKDQQNGSQHENEFLTNQEMKAYLSRKNKFMFILDFQDAVEPQAIMKEISQLLREKTKVETARMKKLEKGGIQVSFKTERACQNSLPIVVDAVYDRLKPVKKRFSFKDIVLNKQTFDVYLDGYSSELSLDPILELTHVIGARRLGKYRVLISLDEKEKAVELVNEGIFLEYSHYLVSHFVPKPKLHCMSCGSNKHKSCSGLKCFKCGEDDHHSSNCESQTQKCLYCDQDGHTTLKCTLRQKSISKAHYNKKLSYSEVLRGERNTSKVRNQKMFLNEINNADHRNCIKKDEIVPLLSKTVAVILSQFKIEIKDINLEQMIESIMNNEDQIIQSSTEPEETESQSGFTISTSREDTDGTFTSLTMENDTQNSASNIMMEITSIEKNTRRINHELIPRQSRSTVVPIRDRIPNSTNANVNSSQNSKQKSVLRCKCNPTKEMNINGSSWANHSKYGSHVILGYCKMEFKTKDEFIEHRACCTTCSSKSFKSVNTTTSNDQ